MRRRKGETRARLRSFLLSGAGLQGGGFALAGSLTEVGVATLLTIMELERRSGFLILRAGRGPAADGEMLFRDGRVVRARVGASGQQGRAAIYQLLEWKHGRFGFSPGVIEASDEINTSTTHLLLEAARSHDEAADRRGGALPELADAA